MKNRAASISECPCQRLPCLRILDCRRIESDAGRLEGIEGPSVGQPVPAGELDRIHVAPGQLGRLGHASSFLALSSEEVQAMALPTQIINQPGSNRRNASSRGRS